LPYCQVVYFSADAASNRKLLSLLLRRAGFGSVDLVEDGQAAVDYCKALKKEDQPGIIFMDNTMPNLVSANKRFHCPVVTQLPDHVTHALQTGIEASKVIRAAGYQHLIIGVTGNSLEDELDEFIAAGADLVIVKPLKNQSLEMLLGFVQAHGFDSAHGYRIDQVGKEFTWVPRSPPEAYREN
jgi:CheY-like chemotaxis protein